MVGGLGRGERIKRFLRVVVVGTGCHDGLTDGFALTQGVIIFHTQQTGRITLGTQINNHCTDEQQKP
uniref:Uncharacterized protein n=1 Tax=Oryza punctata TaxID=4537 RepID=A0A0E0LRD4_ORYPU